MIRKSLIFVLSLLLSCLSVFGNAQNADTLAVSDKKNSFPIVNFIIPTALITYGIVTLFSESLQNFDHSIHEEIKNRDLRQSAFDGWLMYAPVATMYALNLSGVQSRHNLRDQTIILTNAVLLTGASVQAVKHITKIPRPNQGAKTAFPSGHTAVAFAGAHILFKEYRNVSPWIGIGGYLSAVMVGAMRMANQRHWFSDVVAGAGFGILCAEISYLMLPLYHRLFGINDNRNGINSVMIVPLVGTNFYGAGLTLRF